MSQVSRDGPEERRTPLTDDRVPSGDDAVEDAIEHDPVGKQRGHDLSDQPAERSSYRERGANFHYNTIKDLLSAEMLQTVVCVY